MNFWCEPLRSCVPYAREACRSGARQRRLHLRRLWRPAPSPGPRCSPRRTWPSSCASTEPAVALIERLKNRAFADGVRLLLAWARALQGLTQAPQSLSDAAFDEEAWLGVYGEAGFFASIHAVARLQLAVLLGSPAQALAAARHSASLIGHLPGTVWPLAHEFWQAMAWRVRTTTTQRRRSLARDRAAAAGTARVCGARAALRGELPARRRCCWPPRSRRIEGRAAEAAELGAAGRRVRGGTSAGGARGAGPRAPGAPATAARAAARRGAASGRGAAAYGRWGAQAKLQALERAVPRAAGHAARRRRAGSGRCTARRRAGRRRRPRPGQRAEGGAGDRRRRPRSARCWRV